VFFVFSQSCSFSLTRLFLFSSTASGYITLVCDKFNDSTAKWFNIYQIGKKSKVGREHLVSARFSRTWVRSILLSLRSHASSARENTTYSERQTRFCDDSDPSSSKRLSTRSSPYIPIQIVFFPGTYNDPGNYDPSILTHTLCPVGPC